MIELVKQRVANHYDVKHKLLINGWFHFILSTFDKVHGIDGNKKIKGRKRHEVLLFNLLKMRSLHILQKISDGGFNILPQRWIVEHTFAWLGNFHKLSKDWKILISSSKAMIQIAMIKLTLSKCL